MERELYEQFLTILKEELIPAGGCTEPIAIAYAAAVARKTLGCQPEHMDVYASGNLIKNAKAVYIPNGGTLRGVDAAAVLGALGGDADRALEVLLDLPDGVLEQTQALLQQGYCAVHVLRGMEALHLIVNVQADGQSAEVELKNAHTHIVRVEKNGETVFRAGGSDTQDGLTDHSCLTVGRIVEFADTCRLADIEPTLQKQIDCNTRIAEEGLNNRWGVNVGRLYYENGKPLQAYAAAASDARMSGCDLPVVIVSGSDAVRPHRHPSQIRHRSPVRLLRRRLRGNGRGLCHDVSGRRYARADRAHDHQLHRHRLRHRLRRRKALLRSKDRHQSGKRHPGAPTGDG